MSYEDFVKEGYEPSEDELIALFYIEPAEGIPFKMAVGGVAAESSVGTWTVSSYLTDRIMSMGARAYSFNGNWVRIAYPIELFEPGSMPQIWSSIAGNIFGMKAARNIRLEDIYWPPSLIKSFPGPSKGINGIRGVLKIGKRPVLATVPKPKVGMTTEEHVKVAYDVWTGGVDLIKDDENLTNQSFNRFEERVKEVLKMRDKVEKEVGERKSALLNITAPYKEMERRARLVADYGGEFIMVDILTSGWSALQSIREVAEDLDLAIHAHRAFHAAFTRNKKHGVSMKVVASCSRLVGVDTLHIGTVVGKLVSPLEEVTACADILRKEKNDEDWDRKLLKKSWEGIVPVMPVSSGGLHPGLLPEVLRILGPNIMIQVGGGVLGHPDGPKAGAKATRQAIDAFLQGIDLEEYAKTHKELRAALDYWGYRRPV